MEKKFSPSDKPLMSKIIYATVIAILCITAIVVGIVSAANRAKDGADELPPVSDGEKNPSEGDGENTPEPPKEKEPTFISPLVGYVLTTHDLSSPVYSATLGEWRVHAGVDISAENGAPVYAAEDGKISRVYNDPLLGFTVEITHSGNFKSRYSNLDAKDSGLVTVGAEVKSGDRIGTVGDSSISELAKEPHLHFELLLGEVKVNPLDYISEESKKASLGITE